MLYPAHCHTIIVEIAILIPHGCLSQSSVGNPSERSPALMSPKLVLKTAAKMDGAGPIRTFFWITLPQLRPVVLFTVIMSTIGGLQTFTEPQVMVGNSGGTGQSGMTVVLLFYRTAFLDNDYGYAAAIALSIFALVLLFTAINWRIFRGRGEDR